MEQGISAGTDTITIVAEPGALTFATRKEWQKLPEMCLGEIIKHETELVFMGTDSIFFLLKDLNPINWVNNRYAVPYRFVKISVDEDGKQVFHIMTISKAEAEQILRNRLTLWE